MRSTLTYEPDGARDGPAVASLAAALDAERPRAAPARHGLSGVRQVRIGRGDRESSAVTGDTLDLRYTDRWMSGEHARLVARDGGWLVEDAGSKNGCFKNGAPVQSSALQSGDWLELGRHFFVFREWPAPAPPAVEAPETASLSPSLCQQLASVERVAGSTLPVLILGETGTGKELLARAVHASSGRSGRLVPVQCGAIPATLIEAELFGFKKGSFSGAGEDRPGLVSAADRGTLFLDEVGELTLEAQTTLLRLLQEREVRAIGSVTAVPVDIRVVAATNRDLQAAAGRGEFRPDLLARLAGLTIRLPPLRERREDLGLIMRALLERFAPDRPGITLSRKSARALFSHPWPLNVRELEHAVQAALLLCRQGELELPATPATPGAAGPPADPAGREWNEGERLLLDQIVQLLTQHQGNVTAAARAMGKDRPQLYRWIKRYKLDPGSFRR